MGFGIMFLGYFITFVGALVIPLSPYTYVLGVGIILFSLRKLIVENKMFLTSAIFALCLELLSITVVIFNLFAPDNIVCDVLTSIQTVAGSVLNILLLVSILLISKQVGARKILSSTIVNLVVGTISFVFMVLSVLITDAALASRCYFVGYASSIIYTAFTLITIFRCYANICYEDDQNMENEGTGFKPLDALNRWLNKAMDKNRKNNKNTPKNEQENNNEESTESK